MDDIINRKAGKVTGFSVSVVKRYSDYIIVFKRAQSKLHHQKKQSKKFGTSQPYTGFSLPAKFDS